MTVHATEYGRHQGWVDKHPQSHIHAVEKRMVRAAVRAGRFGLLYGAPERLARLRRIVRGTGVNGTPAPDGSPDPSEDVS